MRSIASVRESEGQKMNLKQLIENYTRYCKVQGKTKATLKWYERRLGRFLKFMESSGHSMLVKDVSMADGERHVMQLLGQSQKWAEHPFQKPTEGELSKYTVHGHVRAIRALTNWAYQQGYYPDDPFANLPVFSRRCPSPIWSRAGRRRTSRTRVASKTKSLPHERPVRHPRRHRLRAHRPSLQQLPAGPRAGRAA